MTTSKPTAASVSQNLCAVLGFDPDEVDMLIVHVEPGSGKLQINVKFQPDGTTGDKLVGALREYTVRAKDEA